jgi:predicted secreted hydrolase
MERTANDYAVRVAARDFRFDLRFAPTQPALLEGEQGFSRKGREQAQASYYYSEPQLAISGSIVVEGRSIPVTGAGWLDHEWSSEVMAGDAVGWDWTGINLNDGGALMAFAMRGKDGKAIWAGGTLRTAHGLVATYAPEAVEFVPRRHWRSPRTQVDYPVAMQLHAGSETYLLTPLLEDQELDSSASTGVVYWEGAVRVERGGREVGRGYLELTGYGKPVKF